MAVLVRPRSWGTQVPPVGSSINWGHPLAQNLVGAWIFAEGIGNVAQDLAGGRNAVSHSAPTWAPAPGLGHTSICTANYWTIPNASVFGVPSGGAFTLVSFVGIPVGSSATQVTGLTIRASNPIMNVNCIPSTGTFGFGSRTDGGSFTNLTGAVGQFGDGSVHMLGGVAVGGAMLLYGDGRRLNGNGVSGPPTITVSTAGIGGDTISGTGGTFACGPQYIWKRPLAPSEMAWLHIEPYAFIQPPAPTILYFDMVGPAGASGFAGLANVTRKLGLTAPQQLTGRG